MLSASLFRTPLRCVHRLPACTRWLSSVSKDSIKLGLVPTLQRIIKTGALGSEVTVSGWVRSVRVQKRISFAEVSDGSTPRGIQIIMDDPHMAAGLTTGCSVEIKGLLAESPGRGQSREIQAKNISIIGGSDPETYPLQKKHHSMEYLREIGYLRPRSQTIGAVARLRSHAEMGLHRFFHENEFVRVHTPAITANDCEGGGETFQLTTPGSESTDPASDFFGKRVNLTVSGQLHLEIYNNAFKRVYNFNQAFRAEPSQTGRHLSEFWMVEAECAFVHSLDPLLGLVEQMVQSTTRYLLDNAGDELGFFAQKNEALASLVQRIASSEPFARITYTEAIDILQKADALQKFVFRPRWGQDLQSEHERYLATKHFNGPVFVTDYPAEIKPFYMLPNTDGKTVACMDLLVPGPCELLGGSLREHDFERISHKIRSLGIEEGSLDWYTSLRKYGSVPHGGFGMGFERYIQMVTGLESVRDIIPFPRHAGRCLY
ncbi:asparaginyl-tRNA synthetase [Coemansia sp. RSA 2049]|nr:asparaginyl-tRNA synthetase [Coemansia sp. RSA 2049]